MATQTEAINWLNSQVGKYVDFDGAWGSQCVDAFNFYYQYLTGRSPYSDGYGVPGAKDLWNVGTDRFEKIADSASLKPQAGDILIYGSSWGGGYGHVEMVLSSDANGCTVVGANLTGNSKTGVQKTYRTWAQMKGLIGVMRFKGFAQGDDTMAIKNPEFIKNMYRYVGGREPNQAEINAHLAGTPESLMNGFIANGDLEVNRQRKTIADLQASVTALKANPTKAELAKAMADLKATLDAKALAEKKLAEELAKPPKETIKVVTEPVDEQKVIMGWVGRKFSAVKDWLFKK